MFESLPLVEGGLNSFGPLVCMYPVVAPKILVGLQCSIYRIDVKSSPDDEKVAANLISHLRVELYKEM